jgi:hypothetical protein
MDTRTVLDVKQATCNVIWHIRHAALTLEHAIGSWESVAVLHPTTPEEVQKERLRCMNVVGGLCDQLTRFQAVMNSREEIDPEVAIRIPIASCDTAMTDLRVSMRERLEEKGREQAGDQ